MDETTQLDACVQPLSGVARAAAERTHCDFGHPFDEPTNQVPSTRKPRKQRNRKGGPRRLRGPSRACRYCAAARSRNQWWIKQLGQEGWDHQKLSDMYRVKFQTGAAGAPDQGRTEADSWDPFIPRRK